jgi:hypothetical protein
MVQTCAQKITNAMIDDQDIIEDFYITDNSNSIVVSKNDPSVFLDVMLRCHIRTANELKEHSGRSLTSDRVCKCVYVCIISPACTKEENGFIWLRFVCGLPSKYCYFQGKQIN